MAIQERPLSPHLGIYRWGWTMSLSILHRLTGIILSLGSLLLTGWLLALMVGADAYALVQTFTGHWAGKIILIGWSYCFFYHLCNGIRHMLWDTGWGFDLPTARFTAGVVVILSIALTITAWVLASGVLGVEA
ncbi:MAG TPA: succinate dehydrogenase, cytochrome b556 subunit [Gammaproteobacteria bacterium]|nr:succinate dehydrogenase, cytochrome b556 subunit [Gammaproteobacteria bacterium]